ncbi:MAG: dynamin family protein [Luteolibacter sp.]
MFGERYFATRERLVEVMRGIVNLAGETQAEISPELGAESVQTGLASPFLFVVCGEVNAGKSTLINGLFGSDLCKVNILPETDRVLWYRHGALARDVEITPTLEERYRPIEFLKDFNLVDTPGTNSVMRGHQSITERFLPVADLLLFVFPVSNPWGAATWDFLTKLGPEAFDRVAFVIQQIDQRDPADIPVILGHMKDLAMKRIGHIPPMFAVSGKLAVEAKKSQPFARQAWQSCGFADLEDFISRNVCQSPQRRKLLDTWRRTASEGLTRIENRIEETTRNVERCARFLAEIEREIDGLREQFVIRLPRHLSGVAEVFQHEAVWVAKKLGARLSPWNTLVRLFTGDRSGSEVENLFIERLQTAVEHVAQQDAAETVKACEQHWEGLKERVHAEMGITLRDESAIQGPLQKASSKFVRRLGRAARLGIGNLKVRHGLDQSIRERITSLKVFAALTLLALTGAGICGFLKIPWAPWACLAAAVVCVGIFLTYASTSQRDIIRAFRERLLDACGAFANALRGDYEEALRVFFQEYAGCLEEVRRHVANDKLALEPRLQRWNELFLSLKAIEQDL